MLLSFLASLLDKTVDRSFLSSPISFKIQIEPPLRISFNVANVPVIFIFVNNSDTRLIQVFGVRYGTQYTVGTVLYK